MAGQQRPARPAQQQQHQAEYDEDYLAGPGAGPTRASAGGMAPQDNPQRRDEAPDELAGACNRGSQEDPEREQLQVRKREFNGRPFVDVRIFYRMPGQPYRPTGKGVSIRTRELRDVIRFLEACATRLGV
jgi:hypothetical protein